MRLQVPGTYSLSSYSGQGKCNAFRGSLQVRAVEEVQAAGRALQLEGGRGGSPMASSLICDFAEALSDGLSSIDLEFCLSVLHNTR